MQERDAVSLAARAERGMYVEKMSCDVRGFSRSSAGKTLGRAVDRGHPVLRSGFMWEGLRNDRCRSVQKSPSFRGMSKIAGLSKNAQERRIEDFLIETESSDSCLDGRRFRCALFRLDDGQHRSVTITTSGSTAGACDRAPRSARGPCEKRRRIAAAPSRPYRTHYLRLQDQDPLGQKLWKETLHGFDKATRSIPSSAVHRRALSGRSSTRDHQAPLPRSHRPASSLSRSRAAGRQHRVRAGWWCAVRQNRRSGRRRIRGATRQAVGSSRIRDDRRPSS